MSAARIVCAAGARLGEGALWDDRLACLWWVDVEGCRLHRTDAAGNDRASWDLPHRLGFVALTEDPEQLILGLQPGLFLYAPRTGRLEPLAVPEGHAAAHRLNDGKVDGAGVMTFKGGTASFTGKVAGRKATGTYSLATGKKAESWTAYGSR